MMECGEFASVHNQLMVVVWLSQYNIAKSSGTDTSKMIEMAIKLLDDSAKARQVFAELDLGGRFAHAWQVERFWGGKLLKRLLIAAYPQTKAWDLSNPSNSIKQIQSSYGLSRLFVATALAAAG